MIASYLIKLNADLYFMQKPIIVRGRGGCYYFTFMQEILENKLAALMFNVFVCILLIRAAVHQRAVTVYETYLLFAMNEEWFTNATLFKLFLFFNVLSRLLVIKIVSCLFIYGN